MSGMKHTTVVLTEMAQVIKEDLAPVFGLKNILSAGLILLGKLSTEDQKSVIQEANNIKRIPTKTLQEKEMFASQAREDEAAAARDLTKKKRKKG